MSSQNFVIGVTTQIFFSIMPGELLALPDVTAPVDSTITTTAAIVANDDHVTVTALTHPIPAGTPIVLTKSGTKLTVYTVAPGAATEATSIPIEPASGALDTAATGTYTAKLLLQGGTSSEEQIQAKDTETVIYGTELPYATGAVTGASWQVSYSFNVLPSDPGYFRMKYAAVNGLRGARGWVWKEDPAPSGYTTGESISGLCDITDWSVSNPSDGIITGKCTFKGRGKPTFAHYS